jgi:hypothetical protein
MHVRLSVGLFPRMAACDAGRSHCPDILECKMVFRGFEGGPDNPSAGIKYCINSFKRPQKDWFL